MLLIASAFMRAPRDATKTGGWQFSMVRLSMRSRLLLWMSGRRAGTKARAPNICFSAGYKDSSPDGYYVIPSSSCRILFAFRSIQLESATVAYAFVNRCAPSDDYNWICTRATRICSRPEHHDIARSSSQST